MRSRAVIARRARESRLRGPPLTIVYLTVVMPHYRGDSPAFYDRYDTVGGSPGGIVKTLFSEPSVLFEAVTEGRDLTYLLQLSFHSQVSLAAPLLLIPALPELAANLLSETTTQTSIEFHYTAPIVPFLVAGAILGVARAPRFAPLVLAASLAGAVVLGPLWAGSWSWSGCRHTTALPRGPLSSFHPARRSAARTGWAPTCPNDGASSASRSSANRSGCGRPPARLQPRSTIGSLDSSNPVARLVASGEWETVLEQGRDLRAPADGQEPRVVELLVARRRRRRGLGGGRR